MISKLNFGDCNFKMALFRKLAQGSDRITVSRKTHHNICEARKKKEDPILYQVKQKLRNHSDPKYREMSEDQLTQEATHLIDPDSLKEYFSELTHKPVHAILEEIDDQDSTENLVQKELICQKHVESVGNLTLKLHLSHSKENSSNWVRMGVALLKIPYGVLNASLEIGDTSNPDLSFILEFNTSSLVQPRKKKLIECSALEATVNLGGCKPQLHKSLSWSPETRRFKAKDKSIPRSATDQEISYGCSGNNTPKLTRYRQRSVCISGGRSPYATKKRSLLPVNDDVAKSTNKLINTPTTISVKSSEPLQDEGPDVAQALPRITDHRLNGTKATQGTISSKEDQEGPTVAQTLQKITDHRLNGTKATQGTMSSKEDLTEYIQLSITAKKKFINKLVKIIVQYNKCYYYHPLTRNCQTFTVDVLQSLGVWKNFKLGERLQDYLENLTKGRQEAYKSHKSVNDRVRYLVASKEIEELTYDEARYLRSLYTIFHLEEASKSSQPVQDVCSDQDCQLRVIEKRLAQTRPEGATALISPEKYM